MKTKLTTLLLALILSGCTLASNEYIPIDSPNVPHQEDPMVGIYIGAFSLSVSEIPRFNPEDFSQTFFLFDINEENESSYYFSHVSGNFYDSNTHTHITDEGVRNSFSAKIPVLRNKQSIVSAFIIRKNSNGNYYTELSGNYQGMSSLTFNETQTSTMDDVATETSLAIEIHFVEYDPLIQTRVLLLDRNYTIIFEQFVNEETIIELASSDDIILVEETRLGPDGKEYQAIQMYTYHDVTSNQEVRHMLVGDSDSLFGHIYSIILKPKQ